MDEVKNKTPVICVQCEHKMYPPEPYYVVEIFGSLDFICLCYACAPEWAEEVEQNEV